MPYFPPATAATPGGSNTQIQYNNAGAFGGASGLTTSGTNLVATGTLASNTTGSLNGLNISAGSISQTAGGQGIAYNNGGVTFGWAGDNIIGVNSTGYYGVSSTSGATSAATLDTKLSRFGVANWQFGMGGLASPNAYALSGQPSRSGTDTNTAGGNVTIEAGRGTGNAAGSSLILRAPVAVASGTDAQTQTTIVTVTGAGAAVASGKSLTLGNAAVTGLGAGVLAALTNASIVITDSAGQAYRIPCII